MAEFTLKNIRRMPSLSEETEAFTATVYVDGKRTALASNHGHGGCNFYDVLDRDAFAELEAHAKEWVAQQDDPIQIEETDQFIGHLMLREQLMKFVRKAQKQGFAGAMLVRKGKVETDFGPAYYTDEYLIGLKDLSDENVQRWVKQEGAEAWEVLA